MTAHAQGRTADFDLHGVVGIRLLDALPADVQHISTHLGLSPTALVRAPDVCIRYTRELDASGATLLGLNFAAFDEAGFYVLDRTTGTPQARIAFETVGAQCQVLCRSGMGFVPLLYELLNFAFIARRYVALHASAFEFDGSNVLVMGWEKGGKTESLLAFVNNGARYLADEMVVLSQDGRTMFGIPIPVASWRWQFPYIPSLVPPLGARTRLKFALVSMLEWVDARAKALHVQRIPPFDLLQRGLPALRRTLRVWATPWTMFAGRTGTQGAAPDKVFLLMSHDRDTIDIEPCDVGEIARRMVHSNDFERAEFFAYYRAFKFAFPHLANEFLDTVDATQGALIEGALADKPAYRVAHPYPVPLDALFTHMQPYCATVASHG